MQSIAASKRDQDGLPTGIAICQHLIFGEAQRSDTCALREPGLRDAFGLLSRRLKAKEKRKFRATPIPSIGQGGLPQLSGSDGNSFFGQL
jgi:hypothetical protein